MLSHVKTPWERAKHTLRLAFEPDHDGLISNQPKRWRVHYHADSIIPHRTYSAPMGYRMACEYAEMFGGDVVRNKDITFPAPQEVSK